MKITKEEIIAGSKTIARFMGYEYYPFDETQPDLMPGWWKKDSDRSKTSRLYNTKFHKSGFLCRKHDELRYWNEWNWIMSVVQRIESLDLTLWFYQWDDGTEVKHNFSKMEVDIANNECYISAELQLDPSMTIAYHRTDSKIESTFRAIVEFIEWFNQRCKEENEGK